MPSSHCRLNLLPLQLPFRRSSLGLDFVQSKMNWVEAQQHRQDSRSTNLLEDSLYIRVLNKRWTLQHTVSLHLMLTFPAESPARSIRFQTSYYHKLRSTIDAASRHTNLLPEVNAPSPIHSSTGWKLPPPTNQPTFSPRSHARHVQHELLAYPYLQPKPHRDIVRTTTYSSHKPNHPTLHTLHILHSLFSQTLIRESRVHDLGLTRVQSILLSMLHHCAVSYMIARRHDKSLVLDI